MNFYRTLVSSVLLASSLGFAAAPVVAAPMDCGGKGMHREFMDHRAERMEKHHKKLRAALKLTPEQEGAWKKMIDAEHPMGRVAPGTNEEWAKLTTPERADKMLERMKEHQEQRVAHVAALKEFYAALTPEQQKTFDDFHAAQHGKMHRKMEHRSAGSAKAPASGK